MTIFDILNQEHQLIRRYLDSAQIALEFMREDRFPSTEFFKMGLAFTKTFSDTFHHYKEEYVMFANLAQKNEGEIDGQITALRDQHERARNYTSAIHSVINKSSTTKQPLTRDDKAAVKQVLGDYILLLQQHIHEEDHEFYPLAKRQFTAAELDELLVEFKKVETKSPADFFNTNVQLVEQIEALLKSEFGDSYADKLSRLENYHTN